jgi:hypothetical protein
MKTYLLIQFGPGTDGPRLADEVLEVPGVGKAARVDGPYDLIAEAETDPAGLPALLRRVAALRGVLRALASPVAVGGEAPAAWPRSDIAAGGLS